MSDLRENQLHRLVLVLWEELRQRTDTRALEQEIRRSGLGWALPSSGDYYDEEDRLTVDEIAFELGYTHSAIRNWSNRYGLEPVNGRYRWGDVLNLITDRNQRNHQRRTG